MYQDEDFRMRGNEQSMTCAMKRDESVQMCLINLCFFVGFFCSPAKMKPVKAAPKSHARGVVFEEVLTIDLEEDELLSETNTKISLTRKSK